ncbi:MAG: hypothetical protein M1536_07750 [Firmicutes bacterium]|nr:hypothetical protein [Bacillota bacterium]
MTHESFNEEITPEERVGFWKVLEELGERIGHGNITIQIYEGRIEDLNITFSSKPAKYPEGFSRMMEVIGMDSLIDKEEKK